jgi:hypothetical protein
MTHRSTRLGFVVALVMAATVFVLAGPAYAACGGWTRHATANIEQGDGSELSGVAFRSRTDAWAVGASASTNADGESCCVKTLTAHFDGTSWKRFPSASPGVQFNVSEGSALVDVDTSRTRAWAVGYYDTGCFACLVSQKSLIERFDGQRWVQVRSPNPGPASPSDGERYNAFYDVEAIGDSNAYAVGSFLDPSQSRYFPLIAHWNGNRWTKVSNAGIPSPGVRPELLSVRARSATDLWAVGDYRDIDGLQHTLVLHSTDGGTWTMVPASSPPQNAQLSGVAMAGPNHVWAVGLTQPDMVDGTAYPLTEDGTTAGLGRSPAPNPSDAGAALTDVTSFTTPAGTSAYAVGAYSTGYPTGRLLVERSTPAHPKWAVMQLPKVGDIELFNGVASLPSGDVLAVGEYYDANFVLHTLVESFC